jgi:tRNA G10  N-methylase Trm11
LLNKIKKENIHKEGFKAEYLVLDGDSTGYKERLGRLKDVGYIIVGEPDYYNPSIIYSICYYEYVWYFGILIKQDNGWTKHNNKPCSFSNSIGMYTARALVSIASKGEVTKKLLDACCGVGTVMLEACFSEFDIEGCDINLKAINNAKQNMAHYNYTANLHCTDVKDLNKKYDAAIIDLPYNLYSYSDDLITENIIQSTEKLTTRVVIVSISDIEAVIKKTGLQIVDFCTVGKRGQSTFTRNIWVCEKVKNAN